jgi:hypothetical protein
MDKPQQPELGRSGRGETDPEGRRVTREADRSGSERGKSGKVPPENRPGHHPDVEQDKPPKTAP